MKIRTLFGLCALAAASAVHAYTLDCQGDACKVYCDSEQYVGTMYWNGSQWSDGLRSSPSKEEVARQMVKAQGSSCQ